MPSRWLNENIVRWYFSSQFCFYPHCYLHKSTPSSILWDLAYFKKIFIAIQLQLYAFSPHPSTPPQLNPPPSTTSTLPLDFVHVSFIVVPVIPSPHCPLPTPLWPIVSLFLTSISLVIFCLLFSSVDYVPVKGEIIWYLSFTAWLISLSIMLSSWDLAF